MGECSQGWEEGAAQRDLAEEMAGWLAVRGGGQGREGAKAVAPAQLLALQLRRSLPCCPPLPCPAPAEEPPVWAAAQVAEAHLLEQRCPQPGGLGEGLSTGGQGLLAGQ